jgi:hypothetical protein
MSMALPSIVWTVVWRDVDEEKAGKERRVWIAHDLNLNSSSVEV